mmetsp:Transcript_31670/g.106677  ORF Transcript_31670/g.106677 Transcript_31670/m.106677 type:complete len:239 (-) Transcript_31670:173-889(-)
MHQDAVEPAVRRGRRSREDGAAAWPPRRARRCEARSRGADRGRAEAVEEGAQFCCAEPAALAAAADDAAADAADVELNQERRREAEERLQRPHGVPARARFKVGHVRQQRRRVEPSTAMTDNEPRHRRRRVRLGSERGRERRVARCHHHAADGVAQTVAEAVARRAGQNIEPHAKVAGEPDDGCVSRVAAERVLERARQGPKRKHGPAQRDEHKAAVELAPRRAVAKRRVGHEGRVCQ